MLTALEETATEAAGCDGAAALSPNGLFVAVLSALNSLCCSLEEKLKSQEHHEGGDANRVEKEVSAIVSSLELMRRICPFVVHWSNNEGALFGEYKYYPLLRIYSLHMLFSLQLSVRTLQYTFTLVQCINSHLLRKLSVSSTVYRRLFPTVAAHPINRAVRITTSTPQRLHDVTTPLSRPLQREGDERIIECYTGQGRRSSTEGAKGGLGLFG